MKAEPIVVERVYNAPAHRVWEAITDKEKMAKWYFQLDRFEPTVGFEFSFEGGSENQTYVHLCKVVEVVPGKKIAYTWRYKDHPGNSLVTWEVIPEGDQTRVKLTHEGLETFPQDKPDFAKSSFQAGWTDIVGKLLKDFVETASNS